MYDGNAVAKVTLSGNAFAGDAVNLVHTTASFTNKNVGTDKTILVSGITLSGADAGNYSISGGSSVSSSNGVITQLTSPVVWVGPTTDAYWSNPNNWAGGAIPDFANAKYTTIPAGVNVIYDAGLTAPVQTIVTNSGNITFANLPPGIQAIAMNIHGAGSVTISNGSSITLAGAASTYTGDTILGSGSSLIAASNNAIGMGSIQSNGGSFGTSAGVTLPALNAAGAMTLLSSINTVGTQSYGNLRLASTAAGLNTSTDGATTIRLASQNANISLLGTIDGAVNKTQSMVVDAGTGVVTLGDSIGSMARLNSIDITGRSIYILADILTATSQTYNGSVWIGDADYLNRPRIVGFLFNAYRGYFEYQRGELASSIDYLDADPVYIRTLISEDPSIVFNGAVNDVIADTHTLLVAAIAPTLASAVSNPPVINYGQQVGAIAPLYSINSQTAVSHSAIPASSNSQYVGSINIVGGATTYSSQTYSAQSMTASATTAGGQVTFSVWDPDASVSFMLPTHATNGIEQLNLYNGNLASLAFNGSTNYNSAANTGGLANQWAAPTLNRALGYVPPAVVVANPVTRIDGAILRELLEDHFSNLSLPTGASAGSVSVNSPEEVTLAGAKAKTGQLKKDGGGCSADPDGQETGCAED